MKIGEFFVSLGVTAESVKVRDFAKAIGDIPLEVAGAIGALAGIEFKLAELAGQAIDASVSFEKFTSQTGLNWQELQHWQIVAQQANVSADDMASSVTALQKNLAEIRLGRGNVSPFNLLGINPYGNAFQVLDQLKSRLKGLDRATATNLIQQMGLSPEMINVLTLSDKKFKEFSGTVTGLTKKQEETFLQAKLSLTQFGLVFRQFGYNFLGNVVQGIMDLIDLLKQFKDYLPEIAAGFAVLAAIFAPITVGIIALILALEDLYVYFHGGKSITGDALKGLKIIFDEPIAAAKVLLDLIQQIVDKVGGAKNFLKMASMTNPFAGPIMAAGTLGAGAISKAFNQTNNINIIVHGTGSAAEMAKAVVEEQARAVNAAALQTDNEGR